MTYRGQIKNGVVVLEGNPALKEGTVVNVEPVGAPVARSNGAEIVKAIEEGAHWAGDPSEVDQFLAELKREKQAEVEAQIEQWHREDDEHR